MSDYYFALFGKILVYSVKESVFYVNYLLFQNFSAEPPEFTFSLEDAQLSYEIGGLPFAFLLIPKNFVNFVFIVFRKNLIERMLWI